MEGKSANADAKSTSTSAVGSSDQHQQQQSQQQQAAAAAAAAVAASLLINQAVSTHETIKQVAESIGISNLADDGAKEILSDLTFTVKMILLVYSILHFIVRRVLFLLLIAYYLGCAEIRSPKSSKEHHTIGCRLCAQASLI